MLRRLREIDPALPPDAGATSEARILDYGERDVARPGGKPVRRRSVSPETKRYLVLVVACVLTAASVWAWSQPRTSATPTAGSRVAAEETPTPATTATIPTTVETAGTAATGTPDSALGATPAPAAPMPTASSSPRSPLAGIYVIGGWVQRVDVPLAGAPEMGPVGPDGRIYLPGGTVLDQDGKVVPTARHSAVPQLFDADGNAYGVDNDQETATIWAAGPDGSPVFAYTLQVQAHVDLRLSNGSLIAVYPVELAGDQFSEVLQLDRSGVARSSWRMPGALRSAQGRPQLIIRPNGNLLGQVVRGDGACSLWAFTPAGDYVSQSDCWQSITQGNDGTLVGWSCLQVVDGTCVRSSIAVLNENGTAAKGWPKTYETGTSIPAVGPAGVFYVVSPTGTGSAAVVGFSRAGKALKGWPAEMDRDPGTRVFDGCTCSVLPPVVVADGTGRVIMQTDYELTAWDAAGKLEASWGQVAGTSIGAPIYAGTGDVIFMASADRVEAVRPDSSTGIIPAFVDRGENKVAWLGWQRMPDGGIVVFAYHSGNRESYVVVARLDAPA